MTAIIVKNSIYEEKIDCRRINLKNDYQKKYLDNYFQTCIYEAEDYMNNANMLDIWEMCDMYYEGYQVPIGYSSNALKQFVLQNSNNGVLDTSKFSIKKSESSNQIYVVDNMIGTVIDGMVGEYTGAKKVLNVKNDANPKNNNIEKVVDMFLRKIERNKKMWETVNVPAIEGLLRLGLWWTVPLFSSRINFPYGDLRFKSYHPKDVLLDPFSVMKYFMKGRYCIRKEQVEWDDALRILKKFGVPESEITPDEDYSTSDTVYTSGNYYRTTTNRKFVTFYYPEYRKVYTEYKQLTDESYMQGIEENKFEIDSMYYFEAIYTKQNGTVYHEINKYADTSDHDSWQFRPVPWCNKKSAVRIYPQAHTEKLRNIQDMINIGESLYVDDLRQNNRIRLLIKKSLMETNPTEFKKWLKFGGHFAVDDEDLDLDDLKKAIYQWETDNGKGKAAMDFVNIFEQKFKDQSIRHEALAGSYPDRQMSGVLHDKLAASNKKIISYVDMNIQYAMSEQSKRIYRIMAMEFGAEQYLQIQDKKKGDPDYIPLCSIMTFADLEQYFISANFLDEEQRAYLEAIPPEDPNLLAKKYSILKPVMDQFKKENDVQIQYNLLGESGQLKTSQQQYFEKAIIFINFLQNPDGTWYNLDVKVDIDFESERNEIENRIIAMELQKAGFMDPESAYEFLGGIFADRKEEFMEKLRNWRQELQISQILLANPELMQVVQQLIAQSQQGKQQQTKKEGTTSVA